MDMSNSRNEDILISKKTKRYSEKAFEKVLMDRINNNGIKSKKISQDYFDCIYNGDCRIDRYTYGLNW